MIDQLKQKRTSAWIELKRTRSMFEGIEITYKAFQLQYEEAKVAFSKADYELALVYGRLEKVQETKPKSRRNSEAEAKQFLENLSPEELKQMLKELNIALPEVEEVPMPEEVILIQESEE